VAYYVFNFTKKGASKDKPLREQAAKLLDARLWGIGDRTQNKDSLAPGDRVLAYVGAPERAFIGHATLSSGVHTWSAAEAATYPEDWPAGVAFGDAQVWDNPVALASVWSEMPSSENNPDARFFGGVVRIKQADYERVLAEREHKAPPVSTTPAIASPSASSDKVVDRVYTATERLRKFLTNTSPLTEEATRAHFIDRYLAALGYSEFEDVDYGVQVESGDFADYVLRSQGKPAMVVEAKKLNAPLGAT
jgi:hypothetical protein